MKIITGIGRSGTSVLTQYAKACGHNIGEARWLNEYRAGNEDREFIMINQHIYKVGGGMVNQIRYFDRDVAKDPLFMRDVRILRHWRALREDFEIVYCYRDYEEIAESQRKLPDMMCPAYRCFPDLMKRKEEEFLEACGRWNVPFHILKYPYEEYNKINKLFGGNKELWETIYSY